MATMHCSRSSQKAVCILFILVATSPSFLHGRPEDPVVAALLEETPVAVVVEEPVPSVAVAEPVPVVVPTVTKVVPAAAVVPTVTKVVPAAAVAPIQSEPLGGGIVTEQKNPDGSTLIVTRYNGPIPASHFQKMQRNFPSPFFGFGYPFGYPSFGLPGAVDHHYF